MCLCKQYYIISFTVQMQEQEQTKTRRRSSGPVIVLAGWYPVLLSDARGSAWSAKLEKGQDQADVGAETDIVDEKRLEHF